MSSAANTSPKIRSSVRLTSSMLSVRTEGLSSASRRRCTLSRIVFRRAVLLLLKVPGGRPFGVREGGGLLGVRGLPNISYFIQIGSYSSHGTAWTFFKFCPLASITKICLVPSRLDQKTIFRLSGDQDGCLSHSHLLRV